MADELTIAMRLRGARAVNSELAATNKEIGAMQRNARMAARPLANVSKGLNAMGTNLTRRLSLPLAIAGAAGVKMGLDFDRTMTRIQTLVGVSAKTVDGWRKKVLQMSKETGVAASELGEALYFVTSSGLSLNKALSVTRAVAKGTALGIGESGTIAQLVTSAMNAYAKSNLSAAKTMDILIAGTKAGKLEASDLSESLGRVLPIASRLGVPLQEVVGSMEAMSLTGADAEQAATQLSAFFSGLVKVTPMARKALKGVGLSAEGLRDDLANPRKGLPFVIRELDTAFDGNIETMARVFPNIRALRAQLGLTGDQAKNVNRVFEATRHNSGSLGRAWQELTKSDSFQMTKAINESKVALIQFGATIAPLIIALTKLIAPLADAVSSLGSGGTILLGVLIGLGPALKIAAFGMDILRARAALAAASMAGPGAFSAAAGATSLGAALLALPVTWIVLGLAAIAIGLVVLYFKVERFRKAVNATFHWIVRNWRILAVILAGPIIGGAIVAVVNHWKSVTHAVRVAVHWVEVFVRTMNKIKGPSLGGSGLFKWLGKHKGPSGLDILGAGNRVLGGKADGGTVAQSGRWLVGEKGPEVVSLPRGAHVTPNDGGGELITVPVVLTLDGRIIAESTARVTADRRARR